MSGQHCENYDVKRETVHCYPPNVDRCCTWLLECQCGFQILLLFLFCYITNHLMTGPLGNNEFCFPRISMFPFTLSWETLRFLGNKIHCSPRDQSLSVNCQAQVHTYEGQTTRGLLKASVIHRCLTSIFHVALQVSVLSKVTDYIKMGENKNVIHEAIAECSTDFLTPF